MGQGEAPLSELEPMLSQIRDRHEILKSANLEADIHRHGFEQIGGSDLDRQSGGVDGQD